MSRGSPLVERDSRGRRVRERDRRGTSVATLAWAEDGRLTEAAVRIPDGSWLRVLPGAAHDPRWGATDVVEHAGVTLTGFAAVSWATLDAIPPLAEPARLPPGGGTAILNLIAALAADQGRAALTYRGPYPTEQLFLALLESFNYVGGDETSPPTAPPVRGAREVPYDSRGGRHPLELFLGGGLLWVPHPHERVFDPAGVYVQSRDRVEKVVWRGRAYYREDWQEVARHAVHRVRDEGERVVCSLWALGGAIEDHVILSREGNVLDVRPPAVTNGPPRPLAGPIAAGLVAIVVAASAPPLAAAIGAVAGALVFEWAALDGALAVLDADRARVSTALLRALAVRLAAASSRAEQVRLGFAALTEAAHALGDGLRTRAQARLAAAGAGAQAAALARRSTDAASAAREIGEAVERMLEETAQLRA